MSTKFMDTSSRRGVSVPGAYSRHRPRRQRASLSLMQREDLNPLDCGPSALFDANGREVIEGHVIIDGRWSPPTLPYKD